MNMQQNDTQTGTHTFTVKNLDHRDVSTIRRTLGVHEKVVVSALSDPRLMGALLHTANIAIAGALVKASKAQ